uniref:Uncharacterized protein n=1 Tax=Guillardia theta TaxID=55529 RepID=A0A7S4JFE5_GUITH
MDEEKKSNEEKYTRKHVPLADASKASHNLQLLSHPVDSELNAFFDPSLDAFVNPMLLKDLKIMNALQQELTARKEKMLLAADRQFSNPTSEGVKILASRNEKGATFQWGTRNPLTGVMRLDCSDSLMDAGSNGARPDRLWSKNRPLTGYPDPCGPGDPCRDPCAYQPCNVGETFVVECPPGCAVRAGMVIGGGTVDNPFMDASSICSAALTAGVGREDGSSLITLRVVPAVREYAGVRGGARSVTSIDYVWRNWSLADDPQVQEKFESPEFACCEGRGGRATSKLGDYTPIAKFRQGWGGVAWYGVRGFVLEGAEDETRSAFPGRDSKKLEKLLEREGQTESMLSVDGTRGSHSIAKGAAGVHGGGVWKAMTVEVWVKDKLMREEGTYLKSSGSAGFFLGTVDKQFAWGVGVGGEGKEMDFVLAPDWLTQPNEGKWIHLAGTYDEEDGMKLFIDGLFVGCSKTLSGPISIPADSLDIFAGGQPGSVSLLGDLNEVRVWSVARQQDEIFAGMHKTLQEVFLGPFPAGLELYWRFDFDPKACQLDWLPCGETCDEVRAYRMDLVKGSSFAPSSSLEIEMLTDAKGCRACPPYPSVDFARVSPSGNVAVLENVTIACEPLCLEEADADGGSRYPVCQWDMTYTPGIRCIPLCPPLNPVPHGVLSSSELVRSGTKVTLTCKEGYELEQGGISEAQCLDTHKFTYASLGPCVGLCPPYPPVPNAQIIRSSTRHPVSKMNNIGDQVKIVCDQDYVLSFDSKEVATCLEGGIYDFSSPQCLPVCHPYPSVPNGLVSITGPTVLGDVVEISCNKGYVLENAEDATATCGADHNYDHPQARCVAACPAYPAVDHGRVLVNGEEGRDLSNIREGDSLQVVCDDGYELGEYSQASPTAKCIATAKGGDYDPPHCRPGLAAAPPYGYSNCQPAVCVEIPKPPAPPPPPPPPPPVESKRLVKALFAYEAAAEIELSLEENDIIEVLREDDSGWWQGRKDGRVGWFPFNYVEII